MTSKNALQNILDYLQVTGLVKNGEAEIHFSGVMVQITFENTLKQSLSGFTDKTLIDSTKTPNWTDMTLNTDGSLGDTFTNATSAVVKGHKLVSATYMGKAVDLKDLQDNGDGTYSLKDGKYDFGVTTDGKNAQAQTLVWNYAQEDLNYTLSGKDTKVYDGTNTNIANVDLSKYSIVLDQGKVYPLQAGDLEFADTTVKNAQTGYGVKLSAVGLQHLQTAFAGYNILDKDSNATFDITKRPVTITADDNSKVFDGTEPTLTSTVEKFDVKNNSGIVAGETIDHSVARVAGEDVNSYPINVTAPDETDNYIITKVPGTFKITPKQAIISIVGSDSKVYDGNVAGIDISKYSINSDNGVKYDLKDGDLQYAQTDPKNVGHYTLILTQQGVNNIQSKDTNYSPVIDLSQTNAIYDITKAPITITAPQVSKDFDGNPYSGKIEATIDGKPENGDALSYKLTDVSDKTHAGKYDINVTDFGTNPNYDVTVVQGWLKINPVAAEYTLTGTTGKIYDGEVPNINSLLSNYTVTLPTGIDAYPLQAGDLKFVLDQDTKEVKNVATYKVELTQQGKDNLAAHDKDYTWNEKESQATYVIKKRHVTVTPEDKQKTYDNQPTTDPELTATIEKFDSKNQTGLVNGESLGDNAYTLSRAQGQDVGSYDISVTPTGSLNANYEITPEVGTFKIIKADAKYGLINTDSKTYDGKVVNIDDVKSSYKVTLSNGETYTIVDGDLKFTEEVKNAKTGYKVELTDAGIAHITSINAKNYNYTAGEDTATYDVNKKDVTITANDHTKVFGDKDPVFDAKTDGVVPNETIKYSVDRAKGEDVGPYTITPTSVETDNPNYNVTLVNGTFTITPKPLVPATPNTPDNPVKPDNPSNNDPLSTSIVIKGATKVYDGDVTTDPSTYTVVGPTSYKDFVVPALTADDFDLSGINSQNVGSYVVKLSAAGIEKIQKANKNYSFNAKDIQNGLFVITPAPITITAPTVSKTYDGKPYGAIVGTVTGQPAKGVNLNYSLTNLDNDVNVGSYAISVIPATDGNNNYSITTVTGKLTITPAEANFKLVGNDSKTYDGQSVNINNVKNAYTVNLSNGNKYVVKDGDVTFTADVKNVGHYIVKLTDLGLAHVKASDAKYNFTDNGSDASYDVNKRDVTITALDNTKTYGTADPKLETTVDNLVPGDTLNFNISRVRGENVGKYGITVQAGTNDNYNVKTVPAQFTITPAKASFNLVGTNSKVYDGKSVDVNAVKGSYQVVLTNGIKYQIVNGDLQFNQTVKNAGNYTAQLTAQGLKNVLALSGNYVLTDNGSTATYVVNKKPVTVEGRNYTKVVGTKDPSFVADVSGLVAGDEGQVSYTLNRDKGENAGTYAINVNAYDTQNYTVTTKPGQLTITPEAPISLGFNLTGTDGKVYDGKSTNPNTIKGNYKVNFDNGTVYEVVNGDLQLDRDAKNAGNYKVTLTTAGLAHVKAAMTGTNLVDNGSSATYVIAKADVVIRADNSTKVSDSVDPKLTATPSGLKNGDHIDYTISRVPGEAVVQYAINVTAKDTDNYNVKTVPGTFTITPLKLTFTLIDTDSKVYDGKTVNINNVKGNYQINLNNGSKYTIQDGDLTFT